MLIIENERIEGERLKYEMKPCPFCGCEMVLVKQIMADHKTIRYDPRPKKKHKYGCQLEFCAGMFVGNPTTIKAAVAKWNRRAE